jgi:hypothetical protein
MVIPRTENPFGVPALAGLPGVVYHLKNRLKPGLQTAAIHGERFRTGELATCNLQPATHPRPRPHERGMLEVDMTIAITILFLAILPLAYSFAYDAKAMRRNYERAIAMELLDGKMEVLAAGAWKNYPAGTNEIRLTGNATTNLTTDRALLILQPNHIRLEWRTANRRSQGIIREVKLP